MVYVVFDSPSKTTKVLVCRFLMIVFEVLNESSIAHRPTSAVRETPDQIFANICSNFFAGMQTSNLSPPKLLNLDSSLQVLM